MVDFVNASLVHILRWRPGSCTFFLSQQVPSFLAGFLHGGRSQRDLRPSQWRPGGLFDRFQCTQSVFCTSTRPGTSMAPTAVEAGGAAVCKTVARVDRARTQQETVRDPMLLLGKLLPSSPFCSFPVAAPRPGGAVVRRCPGAYRSLSIPIRVVLPARASWRGRGAKPNTEKCDTCSCSWLCFALSFADRIFASWLKTAGSSAGRCTASSNVLASMSSTAPVQKVGQALAKDLWKEHKEEHEARAAHGEPGPGEWRRS